MEWTKEEIKFLKKFYGKLPGEEIKKHFLNRTYTSVMAMAKLYGLKSKRSKGLWTEKEILFLKDNYSERDIGYLSKKLNRDIEQVRRKVERLALTKPPKMSKNQYEELLILIQNGFGISEAIKKVSIKMGSSQVSRILLRDKRYKKRRYWEECSDEYILNILQELFTNKGYAIPMDELVKNGLPSPETYIKRFGSYSNACSLVGFEDNSQYGKICYSKNNERCLSIKEKILCDFLYDNGIQYGKEVYYGDICPEIGGYSRCDFYLGNYVVVEYFGIAGKKEYDKRTKKKVTLCKKHGIKLISIYANQVNEKTLRDIFSEYLIQ